MMFMLVELQMSYEYENLSGDSDKGKSLIIEGTLVEVSQDLMLKFSEDVVNLDDNVESTSLSVKPINSAVKPIIYAAVKTITSAVKPMKLLLNFFVTYFILNNLH